MNKKGKTVGPRATEKEVKKIAPEKFYVKIKVDFGPKFFAKGPLTNRTMVKVLRKHADKHTKSFLKQMFNHFAEHIDEQAKQSENPKQFLTQPANASILSTYYGCGSCSADGNDDSSLCSLDGVNWTCDPC